jgi:alpha-ribazole phosphatase
METVVDLIRHGQPRGGRRYRGHGIDDPLSEEGWQQMWHAVGDRPTWSRVLTSPMQRCSAFAKSLASKLQVPLNEDERFKEVGFGSWEGKTHAEIMERDTDACRAFYRDPLQNRPQGAEPFNEFRRRIIEALNEVTARYRGDQLLIVCHAGVIRVIITHVLGSPLERVYRIRVDNASLTRIRQDREGVLHLEFHGLSCLR